ncbi:unnamed protein product, partial [marine sediment metagenome]
GEITVHLNESDLVLLADKIHEALFGDVSK